MTLLSNSDYYEGVLLLKRALSDVSAIYPLYCMLSADVEDKIKSALETEGVKCVRLGNRVVDEYSNRGGQSFSYWSHTFDKLQVWGLVQFKKLVFVDSDMLVRRNLDFLFDMEPFTAVSADCSYPTDREWRGLNSGLMVIEPNKDIENELCRLAPIVVSEFRSNGRFVGDQDVINRYIPSWHEKKELHLDEGFNLFATYLTSYISERGFSWSGQDGKPISVVHFIGRRKPWMKKTFRGWLWLIRECLNNPYYFLAYRKYLSYLKH